LSNKLTIFIIFLLVFAYFFSTSSHALTSFELL
jgi:hypothetical protein